MEKVRKLSTAGTIICIISVILYIVVAVLLRYKSVDYFMGFAGDSMDKMGQIDSNSPSAGYEVLAYLAGGALGFLGGLFTIFIIVLLGFLALYQIPAIISGFVANIRYRKSNDIAKIRSSYKVDGFIKAIMNGIVLLIVWLLILGDIGNTSVQDILILFVLIWNFITVFVLSIIQIVNVQNRN